MRDRSVLARWSAVVLATLTGALITATPATAATGDLDVTVTFGGDDTYPVCVTVKTDDWMYYEEACPDDGHASFVGLEDGTEYSISVYSFFAGGSLGEETLVYASSSPTKTFAYDAIGAGVHVSLTNTDGGPYEGRFALVPLASALAGTIDGAYPSWAYIEENIAGVAPGDYVLLTRTGLFPDGGVDASTATTFTVPASGVVNIAGVEPEAAWVSGSVTLADGTPVPGARLVAASAHALGGAGDEIGSLDARSWIDESYEFEVRHPYTSDAAGEFLFPAAAAGVARVAAITGSGMAFSGGDSFVTATDVPLVNGATASADIVIQGAGLITGEVTYASGGYIEGTVYAVQDGRVVGCALMSLAAGALSDCTYSDSFDGAADFAMAVPAGTYDLYFEPRDGNGGIVFYGGGTTPEAGTDVVVAESATVTADIAVAAFATVSSDDVDESGELATFTPEGDDWGGSVSYGSYEATSVIPGTYRARSHYYGYENSFLGYLGGTLDPSAATPVVLAPGSNTVLTVPAPDSGSVEVTLDLSALEGEYGAPCFSLITSFGDLVDSYCPDEPDEVVTFDNIPVGQHTLRVYAGYAPRYLGGAQLLANAETFTVTSGATTQVSFDAAWGGDIAGSVQRERAGALQDSGLAREIMVYEQAPSGAWEPALESYAATDATGAYRIDGLAAGTYKVGFRDYSSLYTLGKRGTAVPEVFSDGSTDLASAPTVTVTESGLSVVDAVIDWSFTDGGPVEELPAQIESVEPVRLASLSGMGSTSPSLQCVNVADTYGIPADATGVVFNVTAAEAAGPGNVVVYPDTLGNGKTPPPNSSTVNFEAGKDVANSAFIQLPANGDVCVKVSNSPLGRLILDVTGYVVGDSGVGLISPERILDTRTGGYHVGDVTGRVEPGQTKTIQVAGKGSVPADAVGVIANVTVTGVSGIGHLRMWASDVAMPNTSVLNYATGQDKANGQFVSLSADGKLSFASFMSSTNVIIDITGYVLDGAPIVPVVPTRIVETRAAYGLKGLSGRLEPFQAKTVVVPESVVPAGASAVMLNVTAIQPSGIGHLRVFPFTAGEPVPDTSSINYIAGRDIPNMVVVPLGATREVGFYGAMSSADLVVDVVGYIVGDS